MKTLQKILSGIDGVPMTTSWYLADIGEAKGRQELYSKQLPQKLKTLREHSLIQSAISSNRIEGVEIDEKRIGTVVFGKGILNERPEEEVRGYQEALQLIHGKGANLPISEQTIRILHSLLRGDIWDAGQYKDKDSDIMEKHPNGSVNIRFPTVPARETAKFIKMLIDAWEDCIRKQSVPSVITLAAFNLDFLCIHPFRDGNGRVSRLLMLLQCYHFGIEIGKFVSLERIIEENKERYYETLKASSANWHRGDHNPWHYINFVCYILKTAFREFENSFEKIPTIRGEKTALLKSTIEKLEGDFSLADLQREHPNTSLELIRHVLKNMRRQGAVRCLGRGRSALWQKIGNTSLNGY